MKMMDEKHHGLVGKWNKLGAGQTQVLVFRGLLALVRGSVTEIGFLRNSKQSVRRGHAGTEHIRKDRNDRGEELASKKQEKSETESKFSGI
jgi:hypothetical protein